MNYNSMVAEFQNMMASYSVVFSVVGILTLIAMWRIFTKAGEAGWKCLIPIYDLHVFARICWKASYFWYSVLGAAVCGGIGAACINSAFGIIMMIAAVVIELVYSILSMKHLSTRFGKGSGFTVLLVLLETIGMLILGFGSDDYQLSRDKQA